MYVVLASFLLTFGNYNLGYWHQRADERHGNPPQGKKTGCSFVGGDDLTGALHDLQLQ